MNFGRFIFLLSSCVDYKLPEGVFPYPLQMFCLLFVDILLGFGFHAFCHFIWSTLHSYHFQQV